MYLLIGEFISVITIGGLTGAITSGVVDPNWYMLLGMLVGLLVGAGMQILTLVLFMPLFGAFEILTPAMLTGMLGGMLTGMLASAFTITISTGSLLCAAVGIGVALWIQKRNKTLQGEVPWT